MTSTIHPTAIVAKGAQIGDGCSIGPYCIVGEHAKLGANVHLMAHVFIDGHTSIGEGTTVFPFASLGAAPQDLKYQGEPAELVIGKNNRIREHVTMNIGTAGGGMITKVGDNGLFMVGVHIAHDCRVGNGVILANNATLAGHVEVGDNAVLGGLSAVHQFVRIGKHAMIGGMSGVESDVIPYGLVKGDRAHLYGLNLVGLERKGLPKEEINTLRLAFKTLFTGESGSLAERLEKVSSEFSGNPLVSDLVQFLKNRGTRAITLPK